MASMPARPTTTSSPSPPSIPSSSLTPERAARSRRAADVVAAARSILEKEGAAGLTMRRLGEELGMRAPSIYKHFPDKAAVEAGLIARGLVEVGDALHAAVAQPRPRGTGASPLPAR